MFPLSFVSEIGKPNYNRLFFSWSGVRLGPLGTSANTGLLYQPWMRDDECETVRGMRIGGGNRSTLREPAPISLCPPQIPHDLT
jgi:hypothetical protein